MPILYKIITSILALTGCTSLMITGEMNILMAASGMAIFPGYFRFFRGAPHAPAWAVGLFSGLTLLVFLFDSLVLSEDVFIAVAHLTITFQAIKSFDLKEPWDHLQVYFMALLQLIIASELTHSLVFGIVFMVFMTMLVTAMVLSHFLKEGHTGKRNLLKPVFVISVLTFFITSIFFISLPRISYRFMGKSYARGRKTVGFSDKVDFVSFGNVKLDPAVVMRIELDRNMPPPFYWRGISLDYFDGYTWKNTLVGKSRIYRVGNEFQISPYDRNAVVEQKVYLEPIDSDVVFGLSDIVAIRSDSFSLSVDSARHIFFSRKATQGALYAVSSIIRDVAPGAKEPYYLQIPDSSKRIADLALKITDAIQSDLQKAVAIEQYLKGNYTYSLSTEPPPDGITPVEDFLFRSRRGFCEHYATSMVLMLRGLGISARIVNGFYGGERNTYGGYIIIRRSDAHSWVEALIDGTWKRFDPTPEILPKSPTWISLLLDSAKMTWTRYVIGYSVADQRGIIKALSAPFRLSPVKLHFMMDKKRLLPYVLLFIAVAGTVAILLKNRIRNRYGFVTLKYLVLRNELKKRGVRIEPRMTAGDIRRESNALKSGSSIEEFLTLYEQHRFGGRPMDSSARKRYFSLLKEIKKG